MNYNATSEIPSAEPAPRCARLAMLGVLLLAASIACDPGPCPDAENATGVGSKPTKIYWLIPDGFRADPELFDLYSWAREGRLPHIRRMMEEGAYGYSIPDFPSHTPTNFASLLTGTHPNVHGIADGPMHTEGAPLRRPSLGGFSSVAKRVPPIWSLLEAAGRRVALLSVPGSTPPELEHGLIVRGRWGGWGADNPAVVFEPRSKLAERRDAGRAFKLFFLGQRLTDFVDTAPASGWRDPPPSFSPPLEACLKAYGLTLYIYVADSTDDGTTNYDRVTFSRDKIEEIWRLPEGSWSPWRPVELSWQGSVYRSQLRAKVIRLWSRDGAFRIRLFFDNANRFNTVPAELAAELTEAAGPMVDFVDNWPPQLIYEEQDRATFLEEAEASWDWHARAARYLLRDQRPEALVQVIYTPNQMLESRWWHRHPRRRLSNSDQIPCRD